MSRKVRKLLVAVLVVPVALVVPAAAVVLVE
jgi:hypothetical protein